MTVACRTVFASPLVLSSSPLVSSDYSLKEQQILNKTILRRFSELEFEKKVRTIGLLLEEFNGQDDFPTALIVLSGDLFSRDIDSLMAFIKKLAKTYYVALSIITYLNEFSETAELINEYDKMKRPIVACIIHAHGSEDLLMFEKEKIDKENLHNSLGLVIKSLPTEASIVFISCEIGKKLAKTIAEFSCPRPVFASLNIVREISIAIQNCCSAHKISMSTCIPSVKHQWAKHFLSDGTLFVTDEAPVRFPSPEHQQVRIFQKKTVDGEVEVTFPCQTVAAKATTVVPAKK